VVFLIVPANGAGATIDGQGKLVHKLSEADMWTQPPPLPGLPTEPPDLTCQPADLVGQEQDDVFMSLGTAPQPPSTLPQYERGSRSRVESATGAGQAPHSLSS
jgi:hypothetical protein